MMREERKKYFHIDYMAGCYLAIIIINIIIFIIISYYEKKYIEKFQSSFFPTHLTIDDFVLLFFLLFSY